MTYDQTSCCSKCKGLRKSELPEPTLLASKDSNGFGDCDTLIRRREERTIYSLMCLNKKHSWSRAAGSRQKPIYIWKDSDNEKESVGKYTEAEESLAQLNKHKGNQCFERHVTSSLSVNFNRNIVMTGF